MSLVSELNNIADELVKCHSSLKNNLIAKGVECSDSDKMSNLIDKVDNMVSFAKVSIGEGKYILYQIPQMTIDTYGTSRWDVLIDYFSLFEGELQLRCKTSNLNATRFIKYEVYNVEGVLKSSEEILLGKSNTGKEQSLYIKDIKPSDQIKILFQQGTMGSGTLSYVKLTCDVSGL